MHKFFLYGLLFANIAMFVLLGVFISSRGGVEYIKIKLSQIKNGVSVQDSMNKVSNYRKSSFEKLPVAESDVLMVGDSLTEHGFWNELLGADFKNRGIGGEITGGLKQWVGPITRGKVRAVVLLIGINNFKHADASVAEYLADMEEILGLIPQDTKVYSIGLLPLNEEMCKEFIHCSNSRLLEINCELKKLTNKFSNVEYVEAGPALVEQGSDQLNPDYTTDGVHLNYNGYVQYANEVLRPLFVSEAE